MNPKEDITVMALRPEQMRPAQEALVVWADERLRALNNDLAEQERNRDGAAATPFSGQLAAWRAQINKTKRVITFYEKIREALDAGYIVVPDFPIEVFAIRTDAAKPVGEETSHEWGRPVFEQHAKLLPAGQGKYVSPRPTVEHGEDRKEKNAAGHEIVWRDWWATEFREVAIPARLVRPEILDATNKALMLKVFDEIGLVGAPKRDPIIVGRILDPRDPHNWINRKRVTFFIAWWLDTRAI